MHVPNTKTGDYKLDITTSFVEMMKNKGKENATYSIQNSFMIRSDTEDSNVFIGWHLPHFHEYHINIPSVCH